MLEAYSLNAVVGVDSAIPFNATSLLKGCTATHPSVDTVDLNKCGVYMVSFDGVAAASTTVQLYKDGVAQPQAQSTGTNPHFTTLVQVTHDNSACACSSPTSIQIVNTGDAEVTFTNCNICVTKIV